MYEVERKKCTENSSLAENGLKVENQNLEKSKKTKRKDPLMRICLKVFQIEGNQGNLWKT